MEDQGALDCGTTPAGAPTESSVPVPETSSSPLADVLEEKDANVIITSLDTVVNAATDDGDGGSGASATEKIHHLEQTIKDLNTDFGVKRATFRELYLKKEEEFNNEKARKEELLKELRRLQDELNEAKSQVTVAEFTKENEVEFEKSKYQHDLTQMRVRFEEKLRAIRNKYEDDIQQLKAINLKLENQSNDHVSHTGNSSEGGPGAVFSAVTKTLRKLNPSVSASNDSLAEGVEESPKTPKQGKYAQEDAEMLRSLVVSLEEEVQALKEKLRSSDDQLATLQGAQASLVKGNDALATLFEGEDVQGVLTQFDDKLREARCGLEAEKSSRADLEMYVVFANAQKTLLKGELEKVKGQLRELRGSYEIEKRKHEELKETWEKANDHFVTTHNEYISVINKYREVLTDEQLDTLKTKTNVSNHIFLEKTEESNLTPVPCEDCKKSAEHVERLQNDLLKAAKLRNEMEEEWGRVSHDYQLKVGALEEQIGTYEVVLTELNMSCQQSMETMENQVKRLTIDRDSIQKKIESLEEENGILKGKHVGHSMQLQNEYISLPNNVMELQEMVLRLKEELISVKVGKEQIEGEYKFLKDQMQMIEEEKISVEENLNAEIGNLQDKIKDLNARLYKHDEERKQLEKNIVDLRNKLLATETHSSKTGILERHNAELIKEKEAMSSEIHALHNQISTLRRELTNSEDLQKDLIALSKSLQMNLESIRQAETDVRWQHPDDISHCNSCRRLLSDSKEKLNCKHCGRIFCSGCSNRTIRRGTRDYNVCGVCHTLLARESAPYFSTEPPHSPD